MGLSLGSVLLEPVVLSEGKLPPLSAIRRYLLSFQTLTAVTNVDHRIAIWNEHHQAKVGDKTVRRMRALSNFRKQSGWILMGALIGHSILGTCFSRSPIRCYCPFLAGAQGTFANGLHAGQCLTMICSYGDARYVVATQLQAFPTCVIANVSR